jgi:molecular chaperone DnaK
MPDFLVGMFQHLIQNSHMMNDPVQAKQLIEAGKAHVGSGDWDNLSQVNGRLWDLMP